MIPLIAFVVASSPWQDQSTINLTPRGESPFVLRDNKVDFFTKQLVIESTDHIQPGLFLIQEAGIHDSTYELAKRSLDGSKVAAIIRRTNNQTTEAWDMRGHQISIKDANVPANILEFLKPNQLAIKITRPIRSRFADSGDFRCQFSLTNDNRSVSSPDLWSVISTPTYQFIDILLPIDGESIVGEFSAHEKTQHSIDGIRFQVVDNKKEYRNKNDDPLRVFRLDQKPFHQYSLRINFDRDLLLKTFPDALNKDLLTVCSTTLAASSDTPKGAAEMYLSCSQAIAFWKSIQVVRKVQLHGYISHLPTQPRSTQ